MSETPHVCQTCKFYYYRELLYADDDKYAFVCLASGTHEDEDDPCDEWEEA